MTRVLGLDLSRVGLGQALEAMAEAWLDAQGVEDTAVAPVANSSTRDGMRQSDWIQTAPIGRTAAYKLIAGLGIESAKTRLPGIATEVAWLSRDQIAVLDAAAARVAGGESVAAVCRYDPPRLDRVPA